MGGPDSDGDLFDFEGFRRSANLPLRAKIDFAVLLAAAAFYSTLRDGFANINSDDTT
jgi:hypothetical protein